jgi:putative restriction endonuclease
VFGEIAGVKSGQRFRRREDLRKAGLHRQPGRGIDASREGALAVVFAGVYPDDRWGEHEAWYTGEGGQDRRGTQVRDQKLDRGNLALKRNVENRRPVRVIRKIDNLTDFEYVYEGLFSVEQYVSEPSEDGPKVYRFLLKKVAI